MQTLNDKIDSDESIMSNQSSQLNMQGKQTEIASVRAELNKTKQEKEAVQIELQKVKEEAANNGELKAAQKDFQYQVSTLNQKIANEEKLVKISKEELAMKSNEYEAQVKQQKLAIQNELQKKQDLTISFSDEKISTQKQYNDQIQQLHLQIMNLNTQLNAQTEQFEKKASSFQQQTK